MPRVRTESGRLVFLMYSKTGSFSQSIFSTSGPPAYWPLAVLECFTDIVFSPFAATVVGVFFSPSALGGKTVDLPAFAHLAAGSLIPRLAPFMVHPIPPCCSLYYVSIIPRSTNRCKHYSCLPERIWRVFGLLTARFWFLLVMTLVTGFIASGATRAALFAPCTALSVDAFMVSLPCYRCRFAL